MAAEDTPATTEPTTPAVVSATAAVTEATSPPPWHESLPDTLKGETALHQFKDVPALAKSYLDTKKMVGAKTEGMLKVPGPTATPEERAAYYAALGVPKAPSDYDVKLPADAPEGIAIDPERFAGYAKVFHDMHMTNEQVNGIVGWALREEAKKQAAQKEQYAQQLDVLAETWGTDVFNRRAGEVQALVRRYADPDMIKWLDASGLTNHPGLFKMLYPIAREFAESGVIEQVGESRDGDVASMDKRLDENRAAYLAAPDGSPARNALLNERERLINLRAEIMGVNR